MKTSITVDLDVVSQIVDSFRKKAERPLTAEIIRAYMGHFVANTGVSASRSWNAQFGKILSAHSAALGMTKLAEENVTDDIGNVTTSARWAFVD